MRPLGMNFIRTSSYLVTLLPPTVHLRRMCTQIFPAQEYDYNAWIFKYFENDSKYSTLTFHPMRKFSPLNIHKETTYQLLSFLTNNKKINSNFFKLIDLELSERIKEEMSADELLVVTNTLALTNRNSMSFKKVLPFLGRKVLNENLIVYKVIQSLFYLSLFSLKEDSKKIVILARKKITIDISLLDKNDMAIFCLSLFSSGVPIADNETLRGITDIILEELSSNNPLFPKLLVCYIKLLRLSQFYDDSLFTSLSSYLTHGFQIPFTSLTHIAVYFSDAYYSDIIFMENLFSQLIAEADRKITKNESIRIKDIDNLLYSASNYCIPEINRIFQNSKLSDIIKKKLNRSPEYKIIDILLWLWILECRLDDVIKKTITPEKISSITGSVFFKDFAKLNLLLTCIKTEAPGLLNFDVKKFQNNRLEPRLAPYLAKRVHLKKAFDFIQLNKESLGLSNLEIAFQVPGLYIAGIKASTYNGPINFEILDDTICLRNSSLPKGQMALKLRLMKRMGEKVFLIKTKEQSNDVFKESLKVQLSSLLG